MDDIVIFSKDLDDHKLHVRQVLQKLKEAGLMANPAKCHWGGSKMEFLCHLVWEGSMSIHDNKVKSLAEYTQPLKKKVLHSFLGVISFYW